MRPASTAYLTGAAAVLVAQVAANVAAFASLAILSRILTIEMFGGYAFGMAVVGFLTFVATLGLDRSLLLRLAIFRGRPERLHGAGLAARTTLAALLAGGVVAVLLVMGADDLVRLGALPEAAFWLPALSATVATGAATMILQTWFQANHRVPVSITVPAMADVARAILFAVVLVLGLGPVGVAVAVALAAAAPGLVLIILAWGRARRSPRHFAGRDLTQGIQFLTLRLSTQGTRQLDIILVGLLASGAVTAEYAVAARLAAVVDYGRTALKPSFVPRARRYLSLGDHHAAQREFDQARHASLALALLLTAAFVLAGPTILRLIGPFEAAYPPLLILAAGYIVNAGFGMHSSYLAMYGEVGWSALLRVAGLGVFVALCVLLVPQLGGLGAALAALGTQSLMNVGGAALAWRITGLKVIDVSVLVAIAVAALATSATALYGLPAVLSASLVGLAAVSSLVRIRLALRQLAGGILTRLRSFLKRGGRR